MCSRFAGRAAPVRAQFELQAIQSPAGSPPSPRRRDDEKGQEEKKKKKKKKEKREKNGRAANSTWSSDGTGLFGSIGLVLVGALGIRSWSDAMALLFVCDGPYQFHPRCSCLLATANLLLWPLKRYGKF